MASLASKITSKATTTARASRKKTTDISHMEALAEKFYQHNAAANAAKRAADKARDELYAAMKADGIDAFTTTAEMEAGAILIKAELKSTTRRVIDVQTLAKLVSPETFIKVVSATQKAVTEQCGTDMVLRCSKEEKGDENVSVSVVK